MKNEFFIRPNTHDKQTVALPFHPYSTGISIQKKGQKELSKDIIKPFVEVIWGLKGVGEIILYEQKFQIRENDVFFYLPGEAHLRYALSDLWKNRWLCFDGPFAEAFILAYKYPRIQHAAQKYPEKLFAELEQIISETDPFLIRRGSALIMDILAHAAGQNQQGTYSEKIAKQALEIISTRLADPAIGVEMLSEVLHVSKNRLTRLFREHTGKTPGRYILDCRLEQAQALLRGTDAPVKEVAARCGFAEPRTFTRFIRRALNCTPLECRRGKG